MTNAGLQEFLIYNQKLNFNSKEFKVMNKNNYVTA